MIQASNKRKLLLSALVLSLAGASVAKAAISYSGGTYLEDFDPESNGALGGTPWVNDSTVPGWVLFSSRADVAGTVVGGVPTTVYRANVSGSATGFYFFRSGAASTDGALGTLNTDTVTPTVGVGYLASGVGLVNTSGVTYTKVLLKYAAEKWVHNSTNTSDSVAVSYAVGATGVSDGQSGSSWTTTTLGFTASSGGVTTTALADLTISPASPMGSMATTWAPNQSLYIRWKDTNISGVDRGTAIDDVTIAAWTSTLSLTPSNTSDGTITNTITMSGSSGNFDTKTLAIPDANEVAGKVEIFYPIAPGDSRTTVVALNFDGPQDQIDALAAQIGGVAPMSLFGSGYDMQISLTGFGASYYVLEYDLSAFPGVTLSNIAVVPEPSVVSGIGLAGAMMLRRRRA